MLFPLESKPDALSRRSVKALIEQACFFSTRKSNFQADSSIFVERTVSGAKRKGSNLIFLLLVIQTPHASLIIGMYFASFFLKRYNHESAR